MKWAATLAVIFLVLTLPAEGARRVDTRALTIRLFSTATGSTVLTDRPPTRQVSKGDVLVVWSKLRNAVAQLGLPKGAVVGDEAATFRIVSRTDAAVTVLVNLPGGTLRAEGRSRLGGDQEYVVIGGRGRFAKARGSVHSAALATRWGSGDRRLDLYRLKLP